MKRIALLFLFIVACSHVWGEQMFSTFLSKQSYSKSDVSLRIDNKEVPIDDFLQVDVATRTPQILSHPAGRRQYIILVDCLYLTPAQIVEVRKLAQDFIKQVPNDDLIALAAITNKDGLQFFSGLTADRSKLIAAWNAIGQVVDSGMTEGPDGNLYPSTVTGENPLPELLPEDAFLENIKADTASENAKDHPAAAYFQSFIDLASLFSCINGRKNLILFSPGIPAKNFSSDVSDTNTEKNVYLISRLIEGSDGHVHVVNPSNENDVFLKDLADKTKGSYVNFSQFSAAISRILSLDETFYVVGWDGSAEKEFHELHTLEITSGSGKIDGPSRFLAPKTAAEYSPLEKKARIAQAIYSDYGNSESYRFWSDVALDSGSNRIATFTEVPGKFLLGSTSKQVSLEFYGFSINQNNEIEDFYNLPIALDLSNPKLIERLNKAGLKVWNVLFSGHGPELIRIIVMNPQTGETITHSSRVPYKDSEFLVSNPFFPSSNFDWIVWPKPDQSLNRRGKDISYPYKLGAGIFVPDLSPRLRADEKGRVLYFKMYNFIPAQKYPSVHLRLVGEDGHPVEIEKFGLMRQPNKLQRDGLEVFWRIETMPALTKGNYRFQVDVTDPHQGKEIICNVNTFVE